MCIFVRVVQEIHYFFEGVFCFILACDIRECGLYLGLRVYPCSAAAERHEIPGPSHTGLYGLACIFPYYDHEQERKHPPQQEIQEG